LACIACAPESLLPAVQSNARAAALPGKKSALLTFPQCEAVESLQGDRQALASRHSVSSQSRLRCDRSHR